MPNNELESLARKAADEWENPEIGTSDDREEFIMGYLTRAFDLGWKEGAEEIRKLKKELRGDIDDLLCKCGCEDCAETTARYDIEASGLDDQRRLRIMRAYVVKMYKENAALKARVGELEMKLGSQLLNG